MVSPLYTEIGVCMYVYNMEPSKQVKTKGGEKWIKVQRHFLKNPPKVNIQNDNVKEELDTRRTSVKSSLQIPGAIVDDLVNLNSVRRPSTRSTRSSFSHSVDFSRQVEEEDNKDVEEGEENSDPMTMTNNQSYLSTIVPYLPVWLAVLCLMINIVLPGIGKLCLSSLSQSYVANFTCGVFFLTKPSLVFLSKVMAFGK